MRVKLYTSNSPLPIFRRLAERAEPAVSLPHQPQPAMGAAVGKAAEGLAGAPETRAAARLAFAEHAILQWNRSAVDGTGIWDADANYTNRGLLAVVDEVLLLAEEDPFPAAAAASSARRHLDGAVAAAVSRIVEEFLRVRVWNASQLRFAVDRLSLVSSGPSAMVFPSDGDRTNSASTDGELDASDGTQSRASSSPPEEVAALVDGEFLDDLHLVCPAGVTVLHEIAQRVIRADGTKEFIRAFADAPCDVLDRSVLSQFLFFAIYMSLAAYVNRFLQ
jgi:exocyst complex component 7